MSTLAEDTDLTFKVRLLGYHTHTENLALAYTESPDNIRNLTKQRFRWAFGTLQALWKHRRIMFKRKYSPFSTVVMPAMWFYSVFFQLLAPVVDIFAIIAIIGGQLLPVLSYFAALFVVDFAGSFVAFVLDGEDARQLSWLFWQRFFYRQFMYYVILKSLAAALRGQLVGWGKLQRHATAVMPTQMPDPALRTRRQIAMVVVVALVIACGAAGRAVIPRFMKHGNGALTIDENVRMVQSISPANVNSVEIDMDGYDGNALFLQPQADGADIRRLMSSLKGITIATQRRALGSTDRIAIRLIDPPSEVCLWGRFDPAKAPVISGSLRSGNLSAIIYDIFKRKGVQPRAGKMEATVSATLVH